tara:strand:+ start:3278 stop:3688 length:411 start_codon:yes stop_codon:yes gene_type:complete
MTTTESIGGPIYMMDKLHIDKYYNPITGFYKDKKGCVYDTAEDFIITGILGYCGCGMPDESLMYIRKILRLIHSLHVEEYDPNQWKELDQFFSSEGEKYTMFYMLEKLELTEHGGCVPGWVTDKGIELLEDLEKLY